MFAFKRAQYLHHPRGSNNRLSEQNRNRDNANRLFDSQNNNQGGYNAAQVVFYEGSEVTVTWTNQHGCGDARYVMAWFYFFSPRLFFLLSRMADLLARAYARLASLAIFACKCACFSQLVQLRARDAGAYFPKLMAERGCCAMAELPAAKCVLVRSPCCYCECACCYYFAFCCCFCDTLCLLGLCWAGVTVV